MIISRSIVRCALFGALLAASLTTMPAQETRKESERKGSRKGGQAEHGAQPAQHNAPQVQRREATQPAQAERPRPQAEPAQRHEQQSQRPQENARPQVYQVQPAPSAQPGRTFGNPPGNGGRTFGNPPGRATENPRGNTQMGARPMAPAPRTFTTRTGDVIHRDSNGQVRQVRTPNGTVVYHPANGPRRVEVVRPGGRVVVATAPGRGYVQRPIVVRNTTIIKRTYIYNGVPHARLYQPRVYHGVTLAIYTPVRYYHPIFYGYVYNPWPRPIAYRWGWGGQPWYGYYGGYFTPYPVYASPSLWLTDFLIAATLEAAYQDRMAARSTAIYNYADDGQSAPMPPQVKQAIADEVRRQIEQERAEGQMANSGGGQAFGIFSDNSPHVFVAYNPLVVNSSVGECTIAEGDVLQTTAPPPEGSPSAQAVVLSSRGADCPRGSTVMVGLDDLQEMQNQMRATLDRGLSDLQSKQGQGGLPQLPPGSTGVIDSPLAQEAQPDPNVAGELTGAAQEGDRAEQQAASAAAVGGPPPTLSLGMSIDEVRAIQGEPEKIVDLGSRKMYLYKDLKITFSDGRVSDIQ